MAEFSNNLSYDAAVARAKGTPDPNARGTERIPLDTDARPESPHHTLGWKPHQAAPGYEVAKVLKTSWQTVFHGTDGNATRPPASVVYWVGSAVPTKARPYDFWLASDLAEE